MNLVPPGLIDTALDTANKQHGEEVDCSHMRPQPMGYGLRGQPQEDIEELSQRAYAS